jgi:hypothetical protein
VSRRERRGDGGVRVRDVSWTGTNPAQPHGQSTVN